MAWQALVNDGSARRGLRAGRHAARCRLHRRRSLRAVGRGQGQAHRACWRSSGKVATLGVVADLATLAKLKPGDEVRVDNSNFLAAQTYHRHQVPDASYKIYDQFRGPDGKPLYPQRQLLLGPLFTARCGGRGADRAFSTARSSSSNSLLDREAVPWQADWYRQQFDAHYGKAAPATVTACGTPKTRCTANIEDKDASTRVVTYLPCCSRRCAMFRPGSKRARRRPPIPSYRVVDGQVVAPATARARHGIQPVVTIAANGGARAEVAVGQPVRFTGTITAPPGTGMVVRAEWDFEGNGRLSGQLAGQREGGDCHRSAPATPSPSPAPISPCCAAFRQRTDAAGTPFAQIRNLARARVVVVDSNDDRFQPAVHAVPARQVHPAQPLHLPADGAGSLRRRGAERRGGGILCPPRRRRRQSGDHRGGLYRPPLFGRQSAARPLPRRGCLRRLAQCRHESPRARAASACPSCGMSG